MNKKILIAVLGVVVIGGGLAYSMMGTNSAEGTPSTLKGSINMSAVNFGPRAGADVNTNAAQNSQVLLETAARQINTSANSIYNKYDQYNAGRGFVQYLCNGSAAEVADIARSVENIKSASQWLALNIRSYENFNANREMASNKVDSINIAASMIEGYLGSIERRGTCPSAQLSRMFSGLSPNYPALYRVDLTPLTNARNQLMPR